MNEDKKAMKTPFQRVALEVVPCAAQAKTQEGTMEIMNHDPHRDHHRNFACPGKITLSVMADGSKLTKADAGRLASFTEELFISVRVLPVESGHTPVVEMTVSEKCHASFVKSDGLLMPDAINTCSHGNA